MTSQIIDSGTHKSETAVDRMENKKDDSPLKTRFLTVRKEIYNRYTEKQETEQQAVSAALKQGMSERIRDSDVIEPRTSPSRYSVSSEPGEGISGLLSRAWRPSLSPFLSLSII